jgi:hypothetical protein
MQWGEEEQFHDDQEPSVILTLFNAQRFRRLREKEREEINDANVEHVVEISCMRASTEEACHLLMATER